MRPTLEHYAIADFLGRESAKVNLLLGKKQRLIELLQEKRTALVTQAVVKGLDPSVDMRDSGVQWLGDIPAHWGVVLLKHVAEIRLGLAPGTAYSVRDLVSRPYLREANVHAGYLSLQDLAEIQVPSTMLDRYELQPGDVLIAEGGGFENRVRGCIWEEQVQGCLHQDRVLSVRPSRGHLRPEFLSAVLESSYGRGYFEAIAKESETFASIGRSKLRNFPLPLPNLNEQEEILHSLRQALSDLTASTGKVELDQVDRESLRPRVEGYSEENAKLPFEALIRDLFQNLYKRIADDRDFSRHLMSSLFDEYRKRVKNGGLTEADLLREIAEGETKHREFKSSLRWNLHAEKNDERITHAALKTVAAFQNSDGGVLYLGVADDGTLLGIEPDGFANGDKFLLHLNNVVKTAMGQPAASRITAKIWDLGGTPICRVECPPSPKPVFVKFQGAEKFYVRSGPSTEEMTPSEMHAYVGERFGG